MTFGVYIPRVPYTVYRTLYYTVHYLLCASLRQAGGRDAGQDIRRPDRAGTHHLGTHHLLGDSPRVPGGRAAHRLLWARVRALRGGPVRHPDYPD